MKRICSREMSSYAIGLSGRVSDVTKLAADDFTDPSSSIQILEGISNRDELVDIVEEE